MEILIKKCDLNDLCSLCWFFVDRNAGSFTVASYLCYLLRKKKLCLFSFFFFFYIFIILIIYKEMIFTNLKLAVCILFVI